MDNGSKQRIVGALVLAALGVIFLPSLFEDKRQSYVDTTSVIPPMPDIQPLQLQPAQPVANIDKAPSPELSYRLEEPETDLSEPALEDKQPVLNAEGLPKAWVVQVASLKDKDNAVNLRDKLRAQGLKAYLQKHAEFQRVLVGPYVDKREALAQQRKLSKQEKLSAQLFLFKP